jgi:hypothetical protein
MKTRLILTAILVTTILSSCKKDVASDWAGTYDGVAGSSTVNRVLVTSTDKTHVRIELQALIFGAYATFATIQNGTVTSSNLTVNEDGPYNGGNYHFSGLGTLNGNTIHIYGSATNNSNSSDVQYYDFTGTK